MSTKHLEFTLNGKPAAFEAPVYWNLLRLLREGFQLTGTKCACEEGECGACTVLLNGRAVTSCLVMAVDVQGQSVETIEGLEADGQLHPLQKAFIAVGAIQCGFCTPGMILAAKALLAANPHPTVQQIREGMVGNLCRCTGYEKIIVAIQSVANGDTWQTEDGVWQRIPAGA